MHRIRQYAITAVAVSIGLGPGLLLPFVLALRLSPSESDLAVLSFSVATALIGIVVPASEARSIAAAGSAFRLSGQVHPSLYRRLVATSLGWAAPVSLVGGTILGSVYSVGRHTSWDYWIVIAVVVVAPLLGAISAVSSGILVSRGMTFGAIATQGFRAVVPLVALMVFHGISVSTLAVLFVVGEALRLIVLSISQRRWSGSSVVSSKVESNTVGKENLGGLPWQMGANALGELNPVVARARLGSFASGGVTAFELAEKVVAISTQIAYNFVFLRRVGSWSTAVGRLRYRRFLTDTIRIFVVALCTGLIGALMIQCGKQIGIFPEAWSAGLNWSCVALVGGPAVAVSAGCVRFIAILNAQRLLVCTVGSVVAVNAVLIAVLVGVCGPIGVVVALVCSRYLLMFGLLFLIRRRVGEGY